MPATEPRRRDVALTGLTASQSTCDPSGAGLKAVSAVDRVLYRFAVSDFILSRASFVKYLPRRTTPKILSRLVTSWTGLAREVRRKKRSSWCCATIIRS